MHFFFRGVEKIGQGLVFEVIGQERTAGFIDCIDDLDLFENVWGCRVVLAVDNVLFLYPKEIPHATTDDFDHPDYHEQDG